MEYGLNLNASFVSNDEGTTAGLHMTNNNGLDVSVEKNGDNFEDVVWDVFDEAIDQLAKHQNEIEKEAETPEDAIARLEKENADLKARMEQLLNGETPKKEAPKTVKTPKVACEKTCSCKKNEPEDVIDAYENILKEMFAKSDTEIGKVINDLVDSSDFMKNAFRKGIKQGLDDSDEDTIKKVVKTKWKPVSFL